LVNNWQEAGKYEISFTADGLADGIYFYRLKTSTGFNAIHKMTLIK